MDYAGVSSYVSPLDETTPSDFQHNLRLLSPYASTMMSELPAEAQQSVQIIVDKMKSIHDDFAARSEHIMMITGIFADGATPATGTLRAFMIGCYRNKEFGLPIGCTPSCLASVAVNHVGHDSIINCEDGVLYYDGHSVSLMNDKLTPSVYMYLAPGQNYPLVEGSEDWKMLVDGGVKKVSVIRMSDAGYVRGGTYTLGSSGSWGWFWFFLILVVIAIIVGLAYAKTRAYVKV